MTTDVVEETERVDQAPEEAEPVSVKDRLAALASGTKPATRRTARKTTRKATGPRKTAPKSPSAVRRQKYGDRLAGWGIAGAAMIAKDPLQRAILIQQAGALGPVVDRLAEEDPRVAAALDKFFGLFGRGGAWAQLGGWAATTGGALALSSGYQHPLLAMMCGGLLEQAATSAATDLAAGEASAAGQVSADGDPLVDPRRVVQLRDQLLVGTIRPAAPPEAPTTSAYPPGDLAAAGLDQDYDDGLRHAEAYVRDQRAAQAGPVGVP